MSPAPKWKMLYFSFKGSWAWKICQLWALVMRISPFLQHEGWPCGSRPGSGWMDVRSPVPRCRGWDGLGRSTRDPQRRGFPGPGPWREVGLESASFFFCVVFCPHAYKVAQVQTMVTLIRQGLSQLLPARPWRLPAESGQGCVVHRADPTSLWPWFPPPCEKRPQYS